MHSVIARPKAFVPASPLVRAPPRRRRTAVCPECPARRFTTCQTKPSRDDVPQSPSPQSPSPQSPPPLNPGPKTSSNNSNDVAPPGDSAREVAGTIVFLAVANEFSIPSLYRRLLQCSAPHVDDEDYDVVYPSPIGSVLHLQRCPAPPNQLAEAFVFAYGCLVVWGSDDDCEHFLALVMDDALHPRPTPVVDTMNFTYGPPRPLRRDLVVLQANHTPTPAAQATSNSSAAAVAAAAAAAAGAGAAAATSGSGSCSDVVRPELERLAVSCALAQSIKLAAFEASMRNTIENTRHLPEQLASSGVISASQRDVSRLMGRLFLDRYRYHLSGDLLVTPVFFDDHEQYLPCYRRVERYLEVRERGNLLDKRVEVLQELYSLLGNEISTQNSMALEFAITVMIAFEILLTVVSLARDSMRSVFWGISLFFALIMLAWVLWRLYRRTRFSAAARPPNFRSLAIENSSVPD